MEVRINNETVDTRIENENNAYEVVRQLDSWLIGEGFFISSILINGEASSPADMKLMEIPVAEIGLLDINAIPLTEFSLDKFATLLQYFSYLQKSIEEENRDLRNDLMQEMPHILESMDDILRLKLGTRQASAVLSELLDENPHRDLDEFLRNLCVFIEGRMREIINPLLELKSTAGLLQSQIPKLEEVPILLQTGKEREAMGLVIAFTEIAEKLTRLYPLLTSREEENLMNREVQGLGFSEFYSDLNARLQELIEAMEAEDTILIGDLLEYEIAPKISELSRSIEELPVFAGKKG